MRTVLFVCTGNICRSPMAACLLRDALAHEKVSGILVESRGLSAVKGSDMTYESREALRKLKVESLPHEAAQLGPKDVERASLILVMEKWHRTQIVKAHPDAEAKTFLFKEYAGTGEGQVADPYGKVPETYRRVAAEMKDAAAATAKRLKEGR